MRFFTPSEPIRFVEKVRRIMEYLEGKDFTSPNEIGARALGASLWNGSAKASPVCLQMVKDGRLERSKRGHYRIKEAG